MILRQEVFLTGDLAFLATIIGKENFDSFWCCFCDLMKDAWQNSDDCVGIDWTLERIAEQLELNETQQNKGVDQRGVREEPFFNIDVDHIIFPVLHALIGIGNKVMSYFIDECECHIEALPEAQTILRDEIKMMDENVEIARADRKQWDASQDGIEFKSLRSRMNQINKNQNYTAWLEGDENVDFEGVEDALLQISIFEELKMVRKQLVNHYDSFLSKHRSAKTVCESLRAIHKNTDDSIYSMVTKLLQRHRIYKAVYHGGDINGVGLKNLMANAYEIMDEIKLLLLERCKEDSDYDENDILGLCDDCALYLSLWDAAFAAAVSVVDPTNDQCDDAQAKITVVMAHLRSMGLTVPPKAHGMECHVVPQMRRIQGGIMKMLEHWVEQYHQTGFKYDEMWRKMGDEAKKARTCARMEHIASDKKVMAKLDEYEQTFVGKRKRSVVKREMQRDVKREKQEVAIASAPYMYDTDKK